MSAMAHKQVIAFTQASGEVKAFDAAAGPAELPRVAAKNQRWAMKSLHHARCDDADDADVPRFAGFNDDVISLRIELRFGGARWLRWRWLVPGSGARDCASRARSRLAQQCRLSFESSNFKRIFRRLQTAGGVESRRELKADFVRADGFRTTRKMFLARSVQSVACR